MMDKYICECCGGKINPHTMTCEYCGTQYKKEDEKVFRIETFQVPVQTFKCAYDIPNEFIIRDPKSASLAVLNHLANELAEVIAPYCEYQIEDDPFRCQKRVRAQIKIIEPINKGLRIGGE